jgi:hypothetical protein
MGWINVGQNYFWTYFFINGTILDDIKKKFVFCNNKLFSYIWQWMVYFNYVTPSNEGRNIVLVWFFLLLPLLLLLSEACPDHNLFVFPDRSIIFGMWVHDHKAVCRTVMTFVGPWPLTSRSNNYFLNSIYLVCGCMIIRRCVAYRNDLRGTLTFDLKVK